MSLITKEEFMHSQPGYPEIDPTFGFYYSLCNKVSHAIKNSKLLKYDFTINSLASNLINYYQDVIADSGIWHTFIDECRRMYGRTLPFFEIGDDYLEYELNPEDVRFIVWYTLSMTDAEYRNVNPFDPVIMELSEMVYDILDDHYNDAPIPANWQFLHELDMTDPEDHEAIVQIGRWAYLLCYLYVPASILSTSQLLESISIDETDKATRMEKISAALEEQMKTEPTGPLALYLREWMHLLINKKLPKAPVKKGESKELHPYYKKVTEAFDGKTLIFFKTYDELNDFLINVIGWEKGVRHLDAMENSGYFAVMVEPEKGMLIARDVARCIASPDNPYYDKEYASEHAFELLTVRGRCPSDLLIRSIQAGWFPDARFPGSDDTKLVGENADFIARCYLQLYNRGD